MNVSELKKGAILSYLLIFVNTFYGLFFTPFLINSLGEGEYGVYKIIASLTASMTILDLGIGSTMLRYIAKFNAKKDKNGISNFSAMGMIQAAVLSVIMLIVCLAVYCSIDTMYANSLNTIELQKAKQLFLLFMIIIVLNTFEKVIFGIIAGCEHFAIANFLKLARIILKLVIALLILSKYADSALLLVIEIATLVLIMAIQIFYIRNKLNIKIKLYKWDMTLFKSSFKYTGLMFIQSITSQFNNNLDNMVIGAFVGAAAVTVYSIGLQLYAMFEQFAMAFSDLMLPSVSKQIADGATNKELEDTVIKVGRLEFMALGGALCGFLLVGKEFIQLWLGQGYELAWYVGLILMVPTMVPLMQNVCLSILRAKNRMFFRTIVVTVMALFNLVITIFGVKYFGSIAACIGTAIGLIFANVVAMNIYYYKIMKLNIFRIFKNILSRTWICCIIASVVLVIVNQLLNSSNWAIFITKCLIFCVIYMITLLLYGFNKKEKAVIFKRNKK